MMKPLGIEIVDDSIVWDIPGPYKLEWSRETARDRISRRRQISSQVIPVATAVAFVATPYLVGATIVAIAPPPFKPIGVAMLVPNPLADAIYFGIGYSVGQDIQDEIPSWLL